MSCCIGKCPNKDKYENENFIMCASCDNMAHIKCLKITLKFYDTLSALQDTHWFCPNCNSNIKNFGRCRRQLTTKLSLMKRKFDELASHYNDCVESLKSFDWLSSPLDNDKDDSVHIVSILNDNSVPPNKQKSLFDLSPRVSPTKSLIGDTLPVPLKPQIFPVPNPKVVADSKSTSTSAKSSSTPLNSQVSVDISVNKDSPSSSQRQPNLSYRACLTSKTTSTPPLSKEKSSETNSSSIPASSSGNSAKSVGNLRIIPKNKSLFVSRFHEATKESEIIDFLKGKSSFFSNARMSIRKLNSKTKREISSFKIDVSPKLFAIINNEGFWPEGVIFHEFVNRPKQTVDKPVSLPSSSS